MSISDDLALSPPTGTSVRFNRTAADAEVGRPAAPDVRAGHGLVVYLRRGAHPLFPRCSLRRQASTDAAESVERLTRVVATRRGHDRRTGERDQDQDSALRVLVRTSHPLDDVVEGALKPESRTFEQRSPEFPPEVGDKRVTRAAVVRSPEAWKPRNHWLQLWS